MEFRRQFVHSQSEIWKQVWVLVHQLRLGVDVNNGKDGVLITSWNRLGGSNHLPDASPAMVKAGVKEGRAQLHIFVSPAYEPAVVQVNALLRLEYGHGDVRENIGDGTVERWFLDQLEQQLGEKGRPFENSRAECATQRGPIRLDEAAKAAGPTGLVAPELVYKAQPVYPLPDRTAGNRGKVIVVATLDELGTVKTVKLLRNPGGKQLTMAALQAVLFWRYRPGLLRNCPVPTYVTITVNFESR